jgi:hypothetical protein
MKMIGIELNNGEQFIYDHVTQVISEYYRLVVYGKDGVQAIFPMFDIKQMISDPA